MIKAADEIFRLQEENKELRAKIDALSSDDCVSRKFMYQLGATCIAARDKNDKLIALGTIENLPSVTPTRKVGKWKRKIVDDGFNADWICTECGYKVMDDFVYFNYCPNCGAKMERGENGIN